MAYKSFILSSPDNEGQRAAQQEQSGSTKKEPITGSFFDKLVVKRKY